MDENEINRKLNNISGYIGTYAINELINLSIRIFPAYMVVNLDKRQHGGTHWIGIAIYLNDIYVCDSLGTIFPDNHLPFEIITFLHRISFKKHLHITKQLQCKTSNTCGKYATYFVHTFSLLHNYNRFLENFCKDCTMNDVIIDILYNTI